MSCCTPKGMSQAQASGILAAALGTSCQYEGQYACDGIQIADCAMLQEGENKARAAAVQGKLAAFWHADRLQMLCTSLVQNYLPLTVGT